jgi:hypothetical protein
MGHARTHTNHKHNEGRATCKDRGLLEDLVRKIGGGEVVRVQYQNPIRVNPLLCSLLCAVFLGSACPLSGDTTGFA